MAKKTYCRICEAACGLTYEDGKLRPDRGHPVSRGFVCAKGTRFLEVANHPTRLREPMIRRAGALEPASWEEAIEVAAAKLKPILERHGPNAVGVYVGNPLAFASVGQLAAIFFSRALGTRNVFTAGSQDCNNKFAAAQIMHGSPVIQPIPDFEHADLAVLFGTNPAVSQASFVHLEGGSTIFDRMEERGAKIVWVDVRRTESAKRWGELTTVRPGTDAWLILALLGLHADSAQNDDRVQGLETLLSFARSVTPARAADVTGVAEEEIRALAAQIGAAKRVTLHMSVGVNQGPFGTLSYVALQALAFVTGNYDARGGSLFSKLGVLAAKATRAAGLFTSTERSRIGDFPTVFDSLPGGILADEITTRGPERIRAMVVIAGDPLRSIPGAARLAKAFEQLDALVCVDLFESLSGRHADVILPATTWLERADFALPSLPLQTVDLLQTTGPTLPRIGNVRADHEALASLSLRLDRPLFGSRIATRALAMPGLADRVIPSVTNAAWRLGSRRPEQRGYGIEVPTPRPGSYLGRGPMTPGHRVRFWHPDLNAERERFEAWSFEREGFVLLGRRRRIGHNSWIHGGTREGKLEGVAWLAPSDMSRLGLRDGATIELETSEGRLRLPVEGNDGVMQGTVVVPHGELKVNVNSILPAGAEHVEPLSGMLIMTGVPVEVRAHATAELDAASA